MHYQEIPTASRFTGNSQATTGGRAPSHVRFCMICRLCDFRPTFWEVLTPASTPARISDEFPPPLSPEKSIKNPVKTNSGRRFLTLMPHRNASPRTVACGRRSLAASPKSHQSRAASIISPQAPGVAATSRQTLRRYSNNATKNEKERMKPRVNDTTDRLFTKRVISGVNFIN